VQSIPPCHEWLVVNIGAKECPEPMTVSPLGPPPLQDRRDAPHKVHGFVTVDLVMVKD
jgi:hypothetical protein